MSFENTSKQARWSCVDFPSIRIISKMYIKVTLIIRPSKLHQKSTSEWRGKWSILTFRHNSYIDSTCWFYWYKRTKLGLVSTQNQRCFNAEFWSCFNVDKMTYVIVSTLKYSYLFSVDIKIKISQTIYNIRAKMYL